MNLAGPANIVAELVVLTLALVWPYVGLRDYSTRMRKATVEAREKALEGPGQRLAAPRLGQHAEGLTP